MADLNFLASLLGQKQPADPNESLPSPLDPAKLAASFQTQPEVATETPTPEPIKVASDDESEDASDVPSGPNPAGEPSVGRLAAAKYFQRRPSADQDSSVEETAAQTDDPAEKAAIRGEDDTAYKQYSQVKPNEILDMYRKLKGAQAQQLDDTKSANLLLAGNQLANAFSHSRGGNIGDGIEAVNALKQQAGLPVQQIEKGIDTATSAAKAASQMEGLRQEQQLADPASKISGIYRIQAYNMLKKQDPSFINEGQLDGVSAQDLQGLMKNGLLKAAVTGKLKFHPVQQPDGSIKLMGINDVTGEAQSYGTAGYANQFLTDPKTGQKMVVSRSDPNMLQGQQLIGSGPTSPVASKAAGQDTGTAITQADINNQAPKIYDKEFKDITDSYNKDKIIQKNREAVNATNNLLTKINAAEPGKPIPVDSGIKEALAAQLGTLSIGGGRVPEGIIKEFGGAGGIKAKIERYLSEKGAGVMTPEDVQFFKDFGLKFYQASQQTANDMAKTYIDRVKQLPGFEGKIDDVNALKLLGGQNMVNSSLANQVIAKDKATAGKTSTPGVEILKDPKSGRPAKFDSKTKKFLGWAD